MSPQFAAYFTIASGAWLLAVLLIKPSNVFDLSRCVGWYLLVFLLTYILRPAGSQLVGDTFMADLSSRGYAAARSGLGRLRHLYAAVLARILRTAPCLPAVSRTGGFSWTRIPVGSWARCTAW